MNLLNLLKKNDPDLVDKLKSKNMTIVKGDRDVYAAKDTKTSRLNEVYWMSDKTKERYKAERNYEEVDFYHRFTNWIKNILK